MSHPTPYFATFVGVDDVFHGELEGRTGTATRPAYGFRNFDYVYFDCFGDGSVAIVPAYKLQPL